MKFVMIMRKQNMVKMQTLLYGQLHCSCKKVIKNGKSCKKHEKKHAKRWYLQRYCRRYWNKIWYFKFEINKKLPKGKNKKVIGLIKNELGGQIIEEFVGLRAKTISKDRDKDKE